MTGVGIYVETNDVFSLYGNNNAFRARLIETIILDAESCRPQNRCSTLVLSRFHRQLLSSVISSSEVFSLVKSFSK